MYQKIDGSNYENVFVVGDLHGCYDELMKELEQAHFDKEKDVLISVGDLIDRGKQNIECLRLVKEPWFKMVQGNHDRMMIDAVFSKRISMWRAWILNGGGWFFNVPDEQSSELLDLLRVVDKQPLILEVSLKSGSKVVIAHADYPDNTYEFGKAIDIKQVLWNRERLESGDESKIEGADMFVFGHTPQDEITKLGNRLYIDTGAVFGNKLSVVSLK